MLDIIDPNIKRYIMKWDGVTFNTYEFTEIKTEIEDESGKFIGSITSGGTFRKWIKLTDDTKSTVVVAYKKMKSLTDTYDIKDNNKNSVGLAKGKAFSWNKRMIMKNKDKKIVLDVKGPRNPSGVWEINDFTGKNIAKFGIKIESTKKGFWNSSIKNTCILQINDTLFDRKILLGFFISVLSSFFDKTSGGGA